MLIYMLGTTGTKHGRLRTHVILLGKYSLFGYITTIAVLQILQRGMRHSDGGTVALATTLVAAFALTMVIVEIVDRMRARTVAVDRLYKAVFA
jgi:hypothetical protein